MSSTTDIHIIRNSDKQYQQLIASRAVRMISAGDAIFYFAARNRPIQGGIHNFFHFRK